jgi:hypothetical protein
MSERDYKTIRRLASVTCQNEQKAVWSMTTSSSRWSTLGCFRILFRETGVSISSNTISSSKPIVAIPSSGEVPETPSGL